MKIKKTTIEIIIGGIIMYSFFPVGMIPTVEFGEFGFLQGGISVGLLLIGLIVMIHATINDMFNLNENKYYFFIKEKN